MPKYARVENHKVTEVLVQSTDPGSPWIEVQEQEHEIPPVEPGWGYSHLHQVFTVSRYPSWQFDPETLLWIPPVPEPEYKWPVIGRWNEEQQKWEPLDLTPVE